MGTETMNGVKANLYAAARAVKTKRDIGGLLAALSLAALLCSCTKAVPAPVPATNEILTPHGGIVVCEPSVCGNPNCNPC